ncbi:MAG: poly-gamma-glutamate hydrolase family protein [Proteobacteria bacterium]|nr:poly-gamma-glutamate hydrolase family protein [Pseudomonadota bacterium]
MDGSNEPKIIDKYKNFASLVETEIEGTDYRVRVVVKPRSNVAVIAPHGGSIERRTSAIASAIAGEDFNLYLFEGLDPAGSFEVLHITSHRFDEPRCLNLINTCDTVVAVHGCGGAENMVMLGGRDRNLIERLGTAISTTGVCVLVGEHPYPGLHATNICNRGRSAQGVQIELTDSLRGSFQEQAVVMAIRQVILDRDD